jgi:outer membrane protein assembly factor BamD (BamD/ComL family)
VPRASRALGDQVAAMDSARSALASGDAAEARRQLDDYEARFPNGVLAQEATVLRIEALLKQGQGGAARALGERFLADHPTSAHAAHVRRMLRDVETP